MMQREERTKVQIDFSPTKHFLTKNTELNVYGKYLATME